MRSFGFGNGTGTQGGYDSDGSSHSASIMHSYNSSEGSDSNDAPVNGVSADLSNTSDLQPISDMDCWGGLQLLGAQCDRENGTTITPDDVANNREPGELESGSCPYQDPLHKDVAANNDVVTGYLQSCGSGSASGCNIGADPLAGNAVDGADNAPSIHSEVNSAVTTGHNIVDTQNVRGAGIPRVSPSDDNAEVDSRVHDDGPPIQLAPLPEQIRTFTMRSFAPFTSLIPRVPATSRPSLTVEDLWGSFGSSLSGTDAPAAPQYSQSHCFVSDSLMEGQDDDSAVD
ncbi:hypothetical protein AAF712_012508 [Marasmius tenuissimus]|uniref:Uncharacterized protein n=1 Tax=Marasmius tenuissimus TaxID=585030 RepID=A0ABR2ZH97_9AGAR